MVNAAKAKGSKAEREVVEYLAEHAIVARRIPAGRTDDLGDIWLEAAGHPTIDVKNHRTMALAAWVDRAAEQAVNAGRRYGAVWHKRSGKASPAAWYVTITGEAFAMLLKEAGR